MRFLFLFSNLKAQEVEDNFEDEGETGESLVSDLSFIVSQVKL